MSKTRRLVISALFATLVCILTMIIKIPSPLFNGYLNFGDSIVLVAGWMLSPLFAFLSASIGSFLADIFSGYMLYAPVTLVIKGSMALCAHYVYKFSIKKMGDIPSKTISAVLAEIIMVGGYYIFEGFLYGFIPSLINAYANVAQGIFGIVLGIFIVKVFKKIIQ
ncbi:MAG: ECF transporter S component [Ruminococcaceae bacterium]|nr:ECF transporter S component [Oscillospiraceae bacterium]